jgi:eukaryotic-like serine/threonine-protein kinase
MQMGRYVVDQLLARGGMGEVYLGRIAGAHGFERPVVIKTIRTELVADERVALMFVDEARLAAGLHHRNIVQIVDFDLFDGGAFLVSEYVPGCDLHAFLRALRAPPPYAIALAIIAEVATGLDAAHRALGPDGAPLGLVHRDVSPSNVLVGEAGEIKIADFGIARARSRSYHTRSGSIKGKAAYMAPEQILGLPVDHRADVYGLGVLLFELTTRTRLYSGYDDLAAMRKILDGPPPEPAARRAGYPAELTAVLRRALSRDPADRHPTARAFADELDEVAARHCWIVGSGAIGSLVRDARRAGPAGPDAARMTPTPTPRPRARPS